MCVFVIISVILDAKTKAIHTFHILFAKICVKNIRNKKISLKILKRSKRLVKKILLSAKSLRKEETFS